MKTRIWAMISAVSLVFVAGSDVFACGGKAGCDGSCGGGGCSAAADFCAGPADSQGNPAQALSRSVSHVGNTVCPVMGEDIRFKGGISPATYEYNGKVFNLCCAGCVETFRADPEKYSALVQQD